MTAPVRFKVVVSENWTVTIEGPAGPVWPPAGQPPSSLWPVTGGPQKAPANTPHEKRFLYQLWRDGMSPAALPDLYDDIFTFGDYTHEQVEQLGRFLFDRLLGEDPWQAILDAAPGAAIVELALRFVGARYELHRFPWELMRGPAGFLAQGQPPASVTRLVDRAPGAASTALAFQSPPRLLFAVGTKLESRDIRPATEIMGLLRQLNAQNLTVRQRVVLQPFEENLKDEVAAFRPDLVHFSCHGGIEREQQARGYLEFQQKTEGNSTTETAKHLHAEELLVALRHGSRLPPVVVLSACYSGSTRPAGAGTSGPPSPPATQPSGSVGSDGSARAAAVDRIGSLAAELVAGGVPVVVGMGGKVADSACRLFTRHFGEALMRGEPLVLAAARGRHGAFLAGVADRADWAFPVLFLDADLPAGCAAQMDLGPVQDLRWRIGHYGVEPYPVFCGRHRFFEAYERLLQRTDRKQVLAISTETLTIGIGRSRLLRELAAQALRDGYVPCLVSHDDPDWPTPPFDGPADLAVEILRAINHAREGFGLGVPLQSRVLSRLLPAGLDSPLKVELAEVVSHDDFGDFLDSLRSRRGAVEAPTPNALRNGLREDLRALIEEARATHPGVVGSENHVVLLLDDADRYGKALEPLLTWLADLQGLGSVEPGPPSAAGARTEPVPVVLCFSLGYVGDQVLKETPAKLRFLEEKLQPFQEKEDEDLLAYGEAMLFPDPESGPARDAISHLRHARPEIKSQVVGFTYNPRASQDVVTDFTARFRNYISGCPAEMHKQTMWLLIECACDVNVKFLKIADDEAHLAKLDSFP